MAAIAWASAGGASLADTTLGSSGASSASDTWVISVAWPAARPAVRASSSAALREGWLVLPDTATSLIGALIGKLLC